MEIKKLWLFIGTSFVTGFIWGRVSYIDLPQHYSDPQTPVGQYDQMVTVDVIKNGDDIWITDHKTGYLIFEYNRFKEADKKVFKEYKGLLIEVLREK